MMLDRLRSRRTGKRSDILFAPMAVAVCAGLVVPITLAVLKIGHSGDWAAWAQAVGTVMAVMAATRIAQRQTEEAAQREHRSTNAHISAASRLVTMFNVRVSAFLDRCEVEGIEDRSINPLLSRSIEASVVRLNRFPLDVISDPDAVVHFVQALESADYIQDWFKKTHDIMERFPDKRADVARNQLPYLQHLARDLEVRERALRRLAEPEWAARDRG